MPNLILTVISSLLLLFLSHVYFSPVSFIHSFIHPLLCTVMKVKALCWSMSGKTKKDGSFLRSESRWAILLSFFFLFPVGNYFAGKLKAKWTVYHKKLFTAKQPILLLPERQQEAAEKKKTLIYERFCKHCYGSAPPRDSKKNCPLFPVFIFVLLQDVGSTWSTGSN